MPAPHAGAVAPHPDQDRINKLLRPFMSNGTAVRLNATGSQLVFSGWGNVGKVLIEATTEGLDIRQLPHVEPD